MSFKKLKLRDTFVLNYGKSLPERDRKEGEYPVYGSSGITGFHNEPLVSGPGIILGRKGSIGTVYFSSKDFFPIDTVYYVTPAVDEVDLRYSYYLLKSLPLKSLNSDAAVPGLNREIAYSVEIKLPSISAQKSIVEVIANYDDLIENNKRRIALLEESARLLYREWFVHFRFPGHEHVKIIDGLPEGWNKKKYVDILGKVKKKGKAKKEEYQPVGLFPCIDQSKDFIGGYVDDTELVFSAPLPVLIFGDHTRIIKFIDFPFVQGADGTQILIPKNDDITPVFFYFLTQSIDLANAFYARHFKFLKATEIILPTNSLIKQFERSVEVNMKQIKTLREMNIKLEKARDILLPRLMNGDLAV
jgi:type I restriction enzyme S subunit